MFVHKAELLVNAMPMLTTPPGEARTYTIEVSYYMTLSYQIVGILIMKDVRQLLLLGQDKKFEILLSPRLNYPSV